MISLRKSATELDRLESLQRETVECYQLAIRSTSQYAIELDAREAADFRAHLDRLADQSAKAEADDLRVIQASFRGELREYRDQAKERIARLRKEVAASGAAMSAFAEAVASNGADHEKQMKVELRRLESVARHDNLAEVRREIQCAIEAIDAAVEHMRHANQATIAQLQDEIRMLHQEMDAERRALITDQSTGAWNRQKIDRRMEELMKMNEPFCALLVSVRNFKRIEERYPRRVVEGALKAMVQRLRAIVGNDAAIGRWDEQRFLVILDLDQSAAIALSRDAAQRLSGAYSVQDGGIAKIVALETTTGVLDRRADADNAAFLKKVDQLGAALAG